MSKIPFFYRVDAASFMAQMMIFKSDSECGKFVKQLSIDLVTGFGTTEYSKKLIAETVDYINKKKKAGSKGGKQKASNARAPLEQCSSITSSKSVANNNISNNNNNNIETTSTSTSESMKMGIFEIRLLHQNAFGTNMPGGCNRMAEEWSKRFTPEAIKQAFEIASVQGKTSMAYVNGVLNGAGSKKGADDFDPNKDYEPGTYFYDLKQSMRG